jgi:hypothetical protein
MLQMDLSPSATSFFPLYRNLFGKYSEFLGKRRIMPEQASLQTSIRTIMVN